MGRKGRAAGWAMTGALIVTLAIALPMTISDTVLTKTGLPAAIAPVPLASASAYLPLRTLAQAVAAQGERPRFADVYSGQYLDTGHGKVLIYVTSMAGGRSMLAAARHDSPGLNLSHASLVPAPYPLRRLNLAVRRLLAKAAPAGAGVTVTGVAAAPDASGLRAMVQLRKGLILSAATIARRLTAASGGIPVTVTIAPTLP